MLSAFLLTERNGTIDMGSYTKLFPKSQTEQKLSIEKFVGYSLYRMDVKGKKQESWS